jgi:2-polyprenyl-3-methyl-5-hydroxy-6-metoxy-1,4-benzoquinol methylase
MQESKAVHQDSTPLVPEEAAQGDALAGRLFQALLASSELLSVHLGIELGLYRALEVGAATARELSRRAGTNERYTREWLEQQAVAGILEVGDDGAGANHTASTFRLPRGHAEALLRRDSPSYSAPMPRAFLAFTKPLEAVMNAFRVGGGVPLAQYGDDIHEVQAELNRPMFIHSLAREWLPTITDVHARLLSDPPARVADIACGAGWSSIVIAQAYPKVRVDGFDVDEDAIALARRNAEECGVAGRVDFEVRDATHSIEAGPYDLVTIFEAVHDLARPVDMLRVARRLLAPGGAVIIGEERVSESMTVPGTELDRFFYTCSLFHCLPIGMVEQPSAGTGAVMRPATLRAYALEAGFQDARVLPIEHGFWRFYRLTP